MNSWFSRGENHGEPYKAMAVPGDMGSFPARSAQRQVAFAAFCQMAGAEEGNPSFKLLPPHLPPQALLPQLNSVNQNICCMFGP